MSNVAPKKQEPHMPVATTHERILAELVERHRTWYQGPEIDPKLRMIIRDAPESKLSDWDIHRLLRAAQAVFFETHVEVVSGHHTASYLRFESIAAVPQLITLIARDMADWIRQTFADEPLTGVITTASDANVLATRVTEILAPSRPLSLVVTPYEHVTGRIGTQLMSGTIRGGDRFIVLNDVTTRGNCVGKLGKVVVDHGGIVAGMMVFARRDSGQFPLVDQLAVTYPFYYTTDLDMPQWEAGVCRLCQKRMPLVPWREVPEL